MKRLFENVEGNRFKLLTESVNGEEYVISGLKKVFGSGLNEISYNRVETVGLGYIKDVSTAQRVSIQEAKRIAESFGYKNDEQNAKFVKTETDTPGEGYDTPFSGEMSDEKREVQIGREILQSLDNMNVASTSGGLAEDIRKLAIELIQIHGGQA